MSGGTRGRSFTGLFAPPKCAASGRVIQTGCQLWMIKIIGRLTRPCSGWPLPFTAHSPRGSAWCSTSRKAETMLGRSFSGRTARGPRRRGVGGKGRRSTCPRFLACYSNTNKDCIERYERGEVKRRFSTQPRRVGTLRGDPRPAARCGERDFFRSNDDEYKQARLLSKSHHHYSPRAAKLNNARRAELPRGTASSAMVSPRPTSGGGLCLSSTLTSSFSHPTCKYYRTPTPAPLSLRAPVVVCLLYRSSQSVRRPGPFPATGE